MLQKQEIEIIQQRIFDSKQKVEKKLPPKRIETHNRDEFEI